MQVIHKTVFVSHGVEFDNFLEAAAFEDKWKAHLKTLRENKPTYGTYCEGDAFPSEAP